MFEQLGSKLNYNLLTNGFYYKEYEDQAELFNEGLKNCIIELLENNGYEYVKDNSTVFDIIEYLNQYMDKNNFNELTDKLIFVLQIVLLHYKNLLL